jgi:nitrogen-specific signal transduction histidine kinase
VSAVRLCGPAIIARPKLMQLFDLIRSFPDQARLALGTRGVIWATAAGTVGLLCCAIFMASIALSLHATEAGYTRHRTVEDSGSGIAPDVLSRLFVGFVTTKARGKGTGLGLRICRRIVEEMDGSISASNRAEGGACFEILLPAADSNSAAVG